MQQLRSGSGCAPEALPVESAVTSLVPRGVGGDAAAATRSASSRSNGAALGSALSIAPTSADVVSTYERPSANCQFVYIMRLAEA